MPNQNYIKGRRKEYAIRTGLIQQGWDIVQRTAGSHSPIDLIAIDKTNKRIKLIQCKPDSMSEKEKQKIINENEGLDGVYTTTFEVI